jgi:hypothetical protein
VFALDGIDPRSWSAADRYAVAYLMLKRQYASDPHLLRELYELVGDKNALAALDRATMHQPAQVEVSDVRPRNG